MQPVNKRPFCANLPREAMANFEYETRHRPSREQDYFISINGGGYGHVATPIKENTLYLTFFDVGEPEQLANWRHGGLFTREMAQQVADHIRLAQSKGANLWVNCHAGISRSGAIVEFLIRLGWRDADFDFQMKRCPNPLVLKYLQEQFPDVSLPYYPDNQFWQYDQLNYDNGYILNQPRDGSNSIMMAKNLTGAK